MKVVFPTSYDHKFIHRERKLNPGNVLFISNGGIFSLKISSGFILKKSYCFVVVGRGLIGSGELRVVIQGDQKPNYLDLSWLKYDMISTEEPPRSFHVVTVFHGMMRYKC